MIIRVKKNTNYTIVSNSVLTSKELSLKAKGLYAYMISLPDDWDFSMAGLEVCLKEGRDAIRSTLKELCDFGIAVHDKKRAEDGTFTSEITIFQEIQPIQESRGGFSAADNPRILSNNRLSTNNKNPTLFCDEEEAHKKNKPKRDLLDKKIAMKDGFEEFWQEYPRGRGDIGSKAMAEQSYLKALKKTNHNEIMAGLRAYNEYLPTTDRPARPPFVDGFSQRAAQAKTWLNQSCWSNEYGAAIQSPEEDLAEKSRRLREQFAREKQQQSA